MEFNPAGVEMTYGCESLILVTNFIHQYLHPLTPHVPTENGKHAFLCASFKKSPWV